MDLEKLEIKEGFLGMSATYRGHLFNVSWSEIFGLVCLEAALVNRHLEHDLRRQGIADKTWVAIENTFDAALTKLQAYIAEDLGRQKTLL